MKAQNLIREHIDQRGITRKHVAEKSGIKIQRFYRLMDGTSEMSADEFVQVCTRGLQLVDENFFKRILLETKSQQAASSA